ncbi:DUF4179 domain-containing protein [Paenibacillus soyae]|uniref:DUF4179 domain-containing protein n=1 Tax=Paenibacillus soyae TaxID=2969249 RepID=A0A9X2SC89_9BACL|nr:DUF4179 domain-containing protein [Paenibacillus soyae]MCR2805762.1 DUF4179 domain-containing protein [Paenibacillus soyae]
MNTIEARMQEHKKSLNTIKAPPDLESRLRHALDSVPARKKSRNGALSWVTAAAAALLLVAGTYQYPAFAYYGGQFLQKIELASSSFVELAEQGYGQTVDKSITLDDGTVITINGVIADDNGLLMYYTIDRLTGSIFMDNRSLRYDVGNMQGFLTDSDSTGGSGHYSKDETRYEGFYKFEPVSAFSRKLTVTFSERLDTGERKSYPISFSFEANKAMNSLLKQDIKQSVTVDRGTITYDSITASPTSTLIKGHYDMEDGEYPRFPGRTKLYVNGAEVESWGMQSSRSNEEGIRGFELEFDVLPTDQIESVELVLDNFTGYQKVEEPISLATPSDHAIRIGGEKLWIRSVTKTDTGYDVVIARKQFVYLDPGQMFVQAGGEAVPVSSVSTSRPWDLNNGNRLWEQTYSFDTAEEPEHLLLDGFLYIKTYNKTLSIPVK